MRRPLSYFSILLGIFTLVAVVLHILHYDLGIDIGGMERMIRYPTIIWALGFGGFMMGRR